VAFRDAFLLTLGVLSSGVVAAVPLFLVALIASPSEDLKFTFSGSLSDNLGFYLVVSAAFVLFFLGDAVDARVGVVLSKAYGEGQLRGQGSTPALKRQLRASVKRFNCQLRIASGSTRVGALLLAVAMLSQEWAAVTVQALILLAVFRLVEPVFMAQAQEKLARQGVVDPDTGDAGRELVSEAERLRDRQLLREPPLYFLALISVLSLVAVVVRFQTGEASSHLTLLAAEVVMFRQILSLTKSFFGCQALAAVRRNEDEDSV